MTDRAQDDGVEVTPADREAAAVALREQPYVAKQNANLETLSEHFARHRTLTRPERPDAGEVERLLRKTAQAVVDQAFDHYTARNGRRMSIEGDDGEKCWIVPFDPFEELRAALTTPPAQGSGEAVDKRSLRTAPSTPNEGAVDVREAIAAIIDPPAWSGREKRGDQHRRTHTLKKADAILAALHASQPPVPAGMVERVARLLVQQRGCSPDSLYQHYVDDDLPTDERIEYDDPFTNEPRVRLMHRAWRKRVKDAEAILAMLSAAPKAAGDGEGGE